MDQREIGELYDCSSRRLEQIVRAGVCASDAVVEDACQFAWSRLVHHRERVRGETALGWLAKTAVREAFRMTRRRASELPLAEETADTRDAVMRSRASSPVELLEQRQALQAIGRLPVRQQRILWLMGFGLSYREMALHEACTPRTVERQLMRARRDLRALTAE